MKNLFIGLMLLAGTASFANNSATTKMTTQNSKNPSATVMTCSSQKDGVTVTVNCQCSGSECREKLRKLIAAL